ncbi:MAG: HDOD domain-containing protein, partial [Planctomycetota bacterium]
TPRHVRAIRSSAKGAGSRELERLFSRIGELSSLPSVAQRVLSVAADGESNAADLLKVVEQDPTLVIRILRSVNSSHYGLRNQVGDLQSAISLLGFIEVRNLAIIVYVARLCEEPSEYREFSRVGLWKHMVATGAIARLVSQECRRADPEEAFVAGLLHDIGLLLIDQYLHTEMRRLVDLAVAGALTPEAERELLSFDHTDLGGYIGRRSGLPDHVCDAIAFHHRPQSYRGRDRELLNVLVLANYLASRNGLPSLGVDCIAPLEDDVLRGLGLRRTQLKEIGRQMASTIESAGALAAI